MFHPVSVFIGLRYLRGQSGDRFSRFVSRISTAGITIGVLSLVVVLSVMNGFESQLKGRILGVLPQAMVYQSKEKTPWSETPPAFISGLPVSHQAEPLVRSEAIIQSTTELSAGILLGISPRQDDPVAGYLIAGNMTNIRPGAYSVFLGSQLARRLNVSPGDKVRLMVTQASLYTPLGRIPSQRNFTVAGVFNTGSDIDGQLMITHIHDAQRLLRLKDNTISGWRLFFDDPFVVSGIDRSVLPDGWHWSDWREQRGELFQAVKMEKNMMGLMLGLIVAIAAFNIISALIMVVMEKQSEVAILKTQGMNKRQVLFIFIVQGASSGIVGAISGGILGILLATYLNEILSVLGVDLRTLGGSLPIDIHLMQVVVVELFTIGLSILATFYPSLRASSVHPAEALRYE